MYLPSIGCVRLPKASFQITSSERQLHIATADGAPGFPELIHDISEAFAAPGSVPTLEIMDDYNTDWDSLYPFSAVCVLFLV
jgi:hypothetical protein